MTQVSRRLVKMVLAAAAFFGVLFVNDKAPRDKAAFVDFHFMVSTADARIGRPLTPLSYAGVARRTTRRAVAVGVVAAPVVVAPVVVTPRCVQAVDAYGRIYTRC